VTGAGGLNQALTPSYSNNVDAGTASRERLLCTATRTNTASSGFEELYDRQGGIW
jgi:hypothetical protein